MAKDVARCTGGRRRSVVAEEVMTSSARLSVMMREEDHVSLVDEGGSDGVVMSR